MSVLPSAYPEQKPIYLRSGDLLELPEHTKYVSLREYLLGHTALAFTERALQLLGAKKDSVRVRSISEFPYNCVGMVLGNRRAWIDMDSEKIQNSLTKDGYKRISQKLLTEGDVVLYELANEFTHIGMVLFVDSQNDSNIWILSKWGFAGEFIHHLHDVPGDYGVASQFWSERVAHDTK
ncbi:MAG: hypothetical protein OXG23_10180 [Chloroflexi bacterium]|nr:hypothetical protein [Chloroflexota bacterium]